MTEERFDRIDERLDRLERSQETLERGQEGLRGGQEALERGQAALARRQEALEHGLSDLRREMLVLHELLEQQIGALREEIGRRLDPLELAVRRHYGA